MACPPKLTLSRGMLVAVTAVCCLLLIAGVAVISQSDSIVRAIEHSNLIVVPGTQMFPNWVDLPVPIVTSIYLFNVTNPDDVVLRGAKPHLVEVGPYVYHEQHHKTKLRWNDNGTVTYQQIRTYNFQPELSNGSLTDKIMTLNAVAAGANGLASTMNKAEAWTIGAFMVVVKEKLFVKKTVQEILFDGYSDPILTATPDWLMPGTPKRFGYYYQRNGSDWFDGVFNMHTGAKDLSKLGQIAQWNYTDQMKFYPGECGKVKGAGDFFSPGQDKKYVELFSNDLCRTLKLDFERQTTSHKISVNEYKISSMFFANSTVNKDNWCFEPGKKQRPSGVFDAGPCRLNAPVYMSQPHFYQADPYYIDQLAPGSMHPDKDKHETTFLVEPLSGLPVDVAARFQVNFRLINIDNMQLFKYLAEELYVPTVWFESKIYLSSTMLTEVWLLSNLVTIFTAVGCILLGLGMALFAVAALHFWNKSSSSVHPEDVGNQQQSEATGTESLVDAEESDPAPLLENEQQEQQQGDC